MGEIAAVSMVCISRVASGGGHCHTLRCSVKPSVPPMATSPSSSRPRFFDCHCWKDILATIAGSVVPDECQRSWETRARFCLPSAQQKEAQERRRQWRSSQLKADSGNGVQRVVMTGEQLQLQFGGE